VGVYPRVAPHGGAAHIGRGLQNLVPPRRNQSISIEPSRRSASSHCTLVLSPATSTRPWPPLLPDWPPCSMAMLIEQDHHFRPAGGLLAFFGPVSPCLPQPLTFHHVKVNPACLGGAMAVEPGLPPALIQRETSIPYDAQGQCYMVLVIGHSTTQVDKKQARITALRHTACLWGGTRMPMAPIVGPPCPLVTMPTACCQIKYNVFVRPDFEGCLSSVTFAVEGTAAQTVHAPAHQPAAGLPYSSRPQRARPARLLASGKRHSLSPPPFRRLRAQDRSS
jgi:hypothetical protein